MKKSFIIMSKWFAKLKRLLGKQNTEDQEQSKSEHAKQLVNIRQKLLDEYTNQIKKAQGQQVNIEIANTSINDQETYLNVNPDVMPFASLLNIKRNCNVPQMFKDAFAYHFGLIVTPDIIHRCLMYTMSSYMKHCAEDLREWVVFHQGKKTLTVMIDDPNILEANQNKYIDETSDVYAELQEILASFNQQIMSDVKDPQFVKSLQSEYSTTTPTELLLNKVEIMNQMQQYYEYRLQVVCGLPFVIVKGTVADWQAMLDKLAYLKTIFIAVAKKNAIVEFKIDREIGYQEIDTNEYIKSCRLDREIDDWVRKKLFDWCQENPKPNYEIFDDPKHAEWMVNYRNRMEKLREEFLTQASEEFKENRNKQKKMQVFDAARHMHNYLVDLEDIVQNILLTRTEPEKTKNFWNSIYSRQPRESCGGPNYYENGWLFRLLMETQKNGYNVTFEQGTDMLEKSMEIQCDVEIGNKTIDFNGGFTGYKVVKVGEAYALEGITKLSYKFK